jgi:plasmid maintenance system antidote protein VapI
MQHTALWQWLKDNGITQAEAAEATGYARSHISAILNGHYHLTPAVKLAFAKAYPETAMFLLPELTRPKCLVDSPAPYSTGQ